MVMMSPSWSTVPPTSARRSRTSMRIASQPETHGLPMRARPPACDVLRRDCENALCGEEAVDVSGLVLAHENHLLARLRAPRRVRVEHHLAGCRSREAGRLAECGEAVPGIELRDEQLLEQHRVDARQRPFLRDQSVAGHFTDVTTIARAFILPFRVCRQ